VNASPRLRPAPLVLVVDDYEDTLELYAQELRASGLEVLTADNGAAAVRLAEALHPVAIFMDIVMPGMDGCEATRRIKKAVGDVPVIALTSTPHQLLEKERALFVAIFSKPCLAETLVDAIRRFLPADLG
jgi:CheY-like chemotaxis protein